MIEGGGGVEKKDVVITVLSEHAVQKLEYALNELFKVELTYQANISTNIQDAISDLKKNAKWQIFCKTIESRRYERKFD